MYLLQVVQTVSTGPRARLLAAERSMERTGPSSSQGSLEDKRHFAVGHADAFKDECVPQSMYEKHSNIPRGRELGYSPYPPPAARTRRTSVPVDNNGNIPKREYSNTVTAYVNADADNKHEKKEQKKKERKWSLGGFFRRRKKEESESYSSSEGEDPPPRKGFLARRRSRREKRKQRAAVASTQGKSARSEKSVSSIELSPSQLPSSDVNYMMTSDGTRLVETGNRIAKDPSNDDGGQATNDGGVGCAGCVGLSGRGYRASRHKPSRSNSRDSLSGSMDRLSRSSRESLLEKHKRDSSLSSHRGGSSGSIDGGQSLSRRERREMLKARVEALRDRLKDSSSEEDGSASMGSPSLNRFRSDDSLQREGSFNRRSRTARTERYIKRLSREEESLRKEAGAEKHRAKDFHVNRVYSNDDIRKLRGDLKKEGCGKAPGRWAATVVYQESSDFETMFMAKTPSATPSPVQSPRARPKNPIHSQYPAAASTFPPSHHHHHYHHVENQDHPQMLPVCMPVDNHPVQQPYYCPTEEDGRKINYMAFRGSTDCPTYKGSFEGVNERDYFGQRNISYENINHAINKNGLPTVHDMEFSNDFPQNQVYRTSTESPSKGSPSRMKQTPPPPPPRDPQRRLTLAPSQDTRPLSYSFENGCQDRPCDDYQGQVTSERSSSVASLSHFPSPNIVGLHQPAEFAQQRSGSDHQLSQTDQMSRLQYFPSHHTSEAKELPPSMNAWHSQSYKYMPPIQRPYSSSPRQCHFQYFADQLPRSRKPIHIQCSDNSYMSDSQVSCKPPYRRSTSMIGAPEFWRNREQDAAKQKTIGISPKVHLSVKSDRSRSNSPRPKEEGVHVSTQENARRTARLHLPPLSIPLRSTDSLSSLSGQSDVSSPLVHKQDSCQDRDSESPSGAKGNDSLRRRDSASARPLSMVLEKSESGEQVSTAGDDRESSVTNDKEGERCGTPGNRKSMPPLPPTRRYSRQSSTSSLEAADCTEEAPPKQKSSNLEDALKELEAIYQSLRLGDEDLLDRAERRDLPTAHQLSAGERFSAFEFNPSVAHISRGAESDSGYNYGPYRGSFESLLNVGDPPRHRAPPQRRSGIPDKLMDDMAYRRFRPKERNAQDARSVLSQSGSYLLVSPALSPAPCGDVSSHARIGPLTQEPDITYDDVTYRNIRHANSIKIIDPQPPFGIPLGPITQASNSDYLHATPTDRYRPTFKPRKTPDVVKDDLAFRNLRKDQKDTSADGVQNTMDDLHSFLRSTADQGGNKGNTRKKRAVRSLSANIASLIQKQPTTTTSFEEYEKAQSLSDLPEALHVAQQILEGKEVTESNTGGVKLRNATPRTVKHRNEMRRIENRNSAINTTAVHPDVAALRDLHSEPESPTVTPRASRYNPSWVERAHLLDHLNFRDIGNCNSTSTETLTDSRANLREGSQRPCSGNWQLRVRVGGVEADRRSTSRDPEELSYTEGGFASRPQPPVTPDRKVFRPLENILQTKPPAPPPYRSPPPPPQQQIALSFTNLDHEVPDVTPLDETKLEELLTALAEEAHATSEKLGRELEELRGDTEPVDEPDLNRSSEIEPEIVEIFKSANLNVVEHQPIETNPDDKDASAKCDVQCENSAKEECASPTKEDKVPVPVQEKRLSQGRDCVKPPQTGTKNGEIKDATGNPGQQGKAEPCKREEKSTSPRSRNSRMSTDRRRSRSAIIVGTPLSRSSPRPGDASGESSEKSDVERRAERVARYKEERRRQLACQYGDRDPSSSEDIPSLVDQQQSYLRHSKRKKEEEDSLSTTTETTSISNSTPVAGGAAASPRRRFITRESSGSEEPKSIDAASNRVRTTKASRLRAAVTSTSSPTSTDAGNKESPRPKRYSLTPSHSRKNITSSSPASVEQTTNSKEGPSVTGAQTSGATGADAGTKMKDKSSKRKSNLNRAMNVEDVATSDSPEDSLNRRRRRRSQADRQSPSTDQEGSGIKSATIIRQLLSPAPAHATSSSTDRVSPLSKDSVVHRRIVRATQVLGEGHKVGADDGDRKPRSALPQKPNLPEVFRPRVTSQSASAGHKPPPAPAPSPDAPSPNKSPFKTSLRKTSESGTNFLLAKRTSEKREVKSELYRLPQRSPSSRKSEERETTSPVSKLRFQSPGRSSPSKDIVSRTQAHLVFDHSNSADLSVDNVRGPDSDISHRVEVLTALTRETVARVDRLTSLSLNSDLRGTNLQSFPSSKGSFEIPSANLNSENSNFVHNSDRVCVNDSETVPHFSEDSGKENVPVSLDIEDKSGVECTSSISTSDVISFPSSECRSSEDKNMSGIRSKLYESNILLFQTQNSGLGGAIIPDSNQKSFQWGSGDHINRDEESPRQELVNVPINDEHVTIRKKYRNSRRPSILKKKSVEEYQSSSPVSILKRKSSQDEGVMKSSPPPLPSDWHRPQGILKKRASLDESVVRSCSPDISIVEIGGDFKPILRQRRSSLEEIRTLSPEPQSILKRKSSREEIEERSFSPEPQGILKRRSSSIVDVGEGPDPRPILKKKSSSEDIDSEPKPILKKKSSTDDELDDKLRPILKASRKSLEDIQMRDSEQSTDAGRFPILKSRSATLPSEVASDSEVKPILKQSSVDKPGILKKRECSESPTRVRADEVARARSDSVPVVSLHKTEASLMLSSSASEILASAKNLPKPVPVKKFDQMDQELNSVLRRRSLVVNGQPESPLPKPQRSLSPTLLMSTNRSSVAERILSMETKFEVNRRKNSFSPPCPAASTGAVPKVRSAFLRFSDDTVEESSGTGRRFSAKSARDKDRFRTQPITLGELQESSSLESVKAFQNAVRGSMNGAEDVVQSEGEEREAIEDSEKDGALETGAEDINGNGSALVPERSCVNGISQLCSPDEVATPSECPVKSSQMEDLGAERRQCADIDGEEEPILNTSVSERALLFMRMQEEQKLAAEEAKARIPKGGRFQRYKDRKERSGRFSTQPITSDEVHEAVLQAENQLSESQSMEQIGGPRSQETQGSDEDDPSKLSLADRVNLFNQKIVDERLPRKPSFDGVTVRKKRGSSRFKTQPVTTEEVEKAQSISPLVASFTKPPDPDVLGSMSISEAKETIYKHAAEILKSSSVSVISTEKSKKVTDESRPKGILKNFQREKVEEEYKKTVQTEVVSVSSSDTEQEVRGILKLGAPQTVEVESSKLLKSVLKKESSFDEPLEVRSILKPESEWTEGSASSDSDSGHQNCEEGENETTVTGNEEYNRGTVNLRGGADLVSILHSVEAHAKQQLLAQKQREEKVVKESVQPQVEDARQLSDVKSSNEATSDGETTSSSGGREVCQIIRNEAVARRRKACQMKQKDRSSHSESSSGLLKSKSHGSVSSSAQDQETGEAKKKQHAEKRSVKSSKAVWQRSHTQPLTVTEQKDAESMSGASIAERLAALQKSGTSDWRKRIFKSSPEVDICASDQNGNNVQAESPGNDSNPSSPGTLAERLGKLDAATNDWRKRVGPTDAVKFSVAGRMERDNKRASSPLPVPVSPLVDRKKRAPRAARFRSKTAHLKEVASTPSSPQKELLLSLKRSISAPDTNDEHAMEQVSVETKANVTESKVAVPRADNETFTDFFRSVSCQKEEEKVEIREEDFDKIISESRQLLVQKKTVRMQHRKFTSRNPIKALAARTDLQEEYVEVKSDFAEKELKRLKVEKLAKNSSLAVEALAGLASKEDFTAVSLKKASSLTNNSAMLPYKDIMLLHIKGRRHVQTRLVEPSYKSINQGDNYVLVAPSGVYNWVGLYANVIERSRGAEVALHIQQKKDLGCSNCSSVITIEDEKSPSSSIHVKNFWKLLGAEDGTPRATESGHPDEDELYEASMIDTNMIYSVEEEELVPVEEYWGSLPKIEMLDPSKIFVFDFGSELYIWSGKNAPFELRKAGVKLVKELWDEGFDYSECDLCPLTSFYRNHESNVKSGASRPSWGLLAKVNQHMETILFREKFLDWPDFSRVIKTKGLDDGEKQVDPSIDIKPCDAKAMLAPNTSEPDLELEGSHLGRGTGYYSEEEHKHYEITTLGVTMWHIMEYEHTQLPATSLGQFHCGDSYVVRWLYRVTVTGRELSGQPSRHSLLGRDRCAYFCWQGYEASLNEQGAAALLTVELDKERGPQIRVVQELECPAFLNIFKGGMVVHRGKRELVDEEEELQKGPWKLFNCRGEKESEAALVEVPCSMRQLRSRASLILLNTGTGVIFVWHGAKSHKHTRQVALCAAIQLKEKKPLEAEFSCEDFLIKEQYEGVESNEFFQGLGGESRQLYMSLLDSSRPFEHTPRLFHLSSVSGVFTATEILSPYRCNDVVMPYPFLQSDLYSANQPALFLFDNHYELWLWQGWWPNTEDGESGDTGSGNVRWQAERRAAMQTALDYWKQKNPNASPRAYLVWAGLEPLKFTNLFPMWKDRDDIAELNIKDGKKPGEVLMVEEELARLTRSTYPPAQLLQRPLPDGVDPTRLELYLAPQYFQELLGMSKEEFNELPTWKQTNIKKDVGLF